MRSGTEAGPVAAHSSSAAALRHDTAHKTELGRRATLPNSAFRAPAAVLVAATTAAAAATAQTAATAAPCTLIGLGDLRTTVQRGDALAIFAARTSPTAAFSCMTWSGCPGDYQRQAR